MRQTRSGMTLVEMMLVLVIAGIVLALASPTIDWQHYEVESAMEGVGLTLLAVERQAITQQHDEIVMLDQTHNALWIHDDANNNGIVDAGERVREMPLGEHIVFGLGSAPAMASIGPGPIGLTVQEEGYPAIVFHRDGSASESEGFYLTLARATTAGIYTQDARAVYIDVATGRASWYRYSSTSGWQRAF
jgi:prepilin-type N-terminal cleavage/methylation domain-containing protein